MTRRDNPVRRRLVVTLICLIGLIVVGLPQSALAGGRWAVKDAQGQKIGMVKKVSAKKVKVTTAGHDAGIVHRTARGKWTAYGFLSGHMEAVHIHHAGLWGKTPKWQLRGFAELGPMPLCGRIMKRNGRWVVQSGNRARGWTTRGSVTGGCPAWAAGGAVFLIVTADERF